MEIPWRLAACTTAGFGRDWLLGRFPAGSLLPDPWLLVGAGHATHLGLLAARRARGGRATVMMTPDLPKALFDQCIIPEHDQPKPASNVIVTRGSLNRMQVISNQSPDRGLLMVGGPSRHFHWNHDEVIDQVSRVIRYSPVRHWVLTTSRRTRVSILSLGDANNRSRMLITPINSPLRRVT